MSANLLRTIAAQPFQNDPVFSSDECRRRVARRMSRGGALRGVLKRVPEDKQGAEMPEELPETPYEQAKTLEHVLLVACEGKRDDASLYQQLRGLLIGDPELKPLLPEFVRTCRDLEHFWQYIKTTSRQWAPRRLHVRDKLTPLFEHLEGTKASPVDADVSNVLASFDAVGTHAIWTKAAARRIPDPEGAITAARTLLETVCKTILEKDDVPYAEKDDLPALYRAVAKQLQLAPSQHTEDSFKRILGGGVSVVEGLGSLRNKLSDAHGRASNPLRVKASPRHAQLAVNFAGAMAMFIVQTWEERQAG